MGFVVISDKGSMVRKKAVDDKTIKAVAEALGIPEGKLTSPTRSIYIYRGTKQGAKRRTKR
jgi:hypothetical protein